MSRSEVDEKNSSMEMCSVKVMLTQLLSSLLAIREEEHITHFLEVINFLYCMWDSMHSLAGQVEQLARESGLATGCNPRTGRCPGTAHLGPGGGIAAPAQLWEGAHSPEGRGGNCWVAVPGYRWCFLHPRLLHKARVLNKGAQVDKTGHSQTYCW